MSSWLVEGRVRGWGGVGRFLGPEPGGLANELEELNWGPGGVTVLFLSSLCFLLLLIIKRDYV